MYGHLPVWWEDSERICGVLTARQLTSVASRGPQLLAVLFGNIHCHLPNWRMTSSLYLVGCLISHFLLTFISATSPLTTYSIIWWCLIAQTHKAMAVSNIAPAWVLVWNITFDCQHTPHYMQYNIGTSPFTVSISPITCSTTMAHHLSLSASPPLPAVQLWHTSFHCQHIPHYMQYNYGTPAFTVSIPPITWVQLCHITFHCQHSPHYLQYNYGTSPFTVSIPPNTCCTTMPHHLSLSAYPSLPAVQLCHITFHCQHTPHYLLYNYATLPFTGSIPPLPVVHICPWYDILPFTVIIKMILYYNETRIGK